MDKTLSKPRHFVENPSMGLPVLASLLGVIFAFAAMGLLFIPYAGIQNDEALFANPIYQHDFEFAVRLFHHTAPLMIMPYVGTLKTFLYWPFLHFFPANAYSVRLPMLMAGAGTIFVFFFLADRLGGRRPAWIATLLLATDPTFLLTDTFDWGPVAINHVLVVTGIWALVKYHQEGAERHRWLAFGFLLFGLALWNKALFLWVLAGLMSATLAVYPKELRNRLTLRRAGIAASAFAVGASPFLLYNVRRHNATLSTSAKLEVPDWTPKLIQVGGALNGQSLNGYLVSAEGREKPKILASIAGRTALMIRDVFGEHRASLGEYAALACLLAVPLWWRSRTARFALIFLIVGWLMMAITKDAGTSAHHVVLLWPFPQLFIGVTLGARRLSGIPDQIVPGLLTAVLVVSNLLVINQYLLQMERDGPGPFFTDAIYRLSDALRSEAAQTVYVTDWGMQNSLALLSRGHLKLETAEGDFAADNIGPDQQNHIAKMASDPNAVFVGHAAGQEIFTGSRQRVIQAADHADLHKQILEVIEDSNGRPAFEIFRWTAGAEASPTH